MADEVVFTMAELIEIRDHATESLKSAKVDLKAAKERAGSLHIQLLGINHLIEHREKEAAAAARWESDWADRKRMEKAKEATRLERAEKAKDATRLERPIARPSDSIANASGVLVSMKKSAQKCDACGFERKSMKITWRPGPNGPGTLCHGCGMDWNSVGKDPRWLTPKMIAEREKWRSVTEARKRGKEASASLPAKRGRYAAVEESEDESDS